MHLELFVRYDSIYSVVSAIDEDFEAGLKSKEKDQMREHIQIAFTLSVKQMIVAVAKMDVCGWSEKMVQ